MNFQKLKKEVVLIFDKKKLIIFSFFTAITFQFFSRNINEINEILISANNSKSTISLVKIEEKRNYSQNKNLETYLNLKYIE